MPYEQKFHPTLKECQPRKSSRPCDTNISATFRATELFVFMHSSIVNGYQLMCNAHNVLQPYRGTAAFFYFTHYLPIPLFMCLSL